MTSAIDTTEYAWRVEQGEREEIDVPVFDNGTPRDLTGWTISAVVKDRPGGTVLHTFTPAQISAAGNVVTLTVPGPVSAAWTWTVGWWRLKVTAPNPDPVDPETYRVAQGPFLVYRD